MIGLYRSLWSGLEDWPLHVALPAGTLLAFFTFAVVRIVAAFVLYGLEKLLERGEWIARAPSFADMMRRARWLAALSRLALRAQESAGISYGADDAHRRRLRRYPRRTRLPGVLIKAVAAVWWLLFRVIGLAWSLSRLLVTPTWIVAGCWVVSALVLVPASAEALGSDNLPNWIEHHWTLAAPLLAVATALLGIAFSARRPRVRSRVQYRVATELRCLEVLARMELSLRDLWLAMWELGEDSWPSARTQLQDLVNRTSQGWCELDEDCVVQLLRQPRTGLSPPYPTLDHPDLDAALAIIEREYTTIGQPSERRHLARLLGRDALRLTPYFARGWKGTLDDLSSEAIGREFDKEFDQGARSNSFDECGDLASEPATKARERAAEALQDAVDRCLWCHRRRAACVVASCVEVENALRGTRLAPRLSPIDRLVRL